MPAPLRVGLIGYGLSGRIFHAPFIADHPELELTIIVTSSSERSRAAAAAHPRARIVADLDLVEDEALDLLVLGGPPQTHRAHARWAIEHDVAVVIDKPFMPSVAEAVEVLEFAESRGGRLTVFHNRRWDGDFLGLCALSTDPAIGEVFELESAFEHWDPFPRPDWKHRLPVSRGGGVTMDLGSHLVDQAILLLGPVTDVHADLRAIRAGAGNDDVARLRLTHLAGAHSTIRVSRLGNQPAPRFRLSATKGSVLIHGLDSQEPLLEAGSAVADLDSSQRSRPRNALIRTDAGDREEPLPPGNYAAFYAAVADWLHGRDSAPVDPYEALEVLRVLERATASLR